MAAPETLQTDPDDHAPSWARDVLQRQMDVLGELAEAGLEIAKATARRAVAQAEQDPAEAQGGEDNLAMVYARVARAVRLTLMLQAKAVEALRAFDLGERARADAALQARAQASPEYAHKARVERIVERVAQAACGRDEDEVDRLVREAGERLDDDDIWGDVLARPVGELVRAICRDLGLDPDWTRLAEEAWAQAEKHHPRSPFSVSSPVAEAAGRGGPLAEERVVEGANDGALLFSCALVHAGSP